MSIPFRFASLGSGSGGNCTVIATARTAILVDCGFSALETERRLEQLHACPRNVDAILVTHEHFDHRKGVPVMSRRWDIPVYASSGTAGVLRSAGVSPSRLRHLRSGEDCRIGELAVRSIPVPHDAVEPLQFVVRHKGLALGILTDTGHVPDKVLDAYRDCHALLLESNHDLDLLWNGNDPPMLKDRIASPFGHLSNDEAFRVVSVLIHERLRHLVIGHTSARNNCRDLLKNFFDGFSENLSSLTYATQKEGTFGWVSVK